jgi:hypothetical protein
MKKTILLALLSVLGASSASAALTFASANTSVGFTTSTGSLIDAANTRVRYGHFQDPTSIFANRDDLAALEANFIEILSFTASAIQGANATGEWSIASAAFNPAATYEGFTYDATAGDTNTNNPSVDIAGSEIYAWVMSGLTNATTTEHAVFAKTTQLWGDSNLVPTQNMNPGFTSASAVASANRIIGDNGNTFNGGITLSGNSIGSHELYAIAAIPEPSRAMLGFVGLAAMLFRRRRA